MFGFDRLILNITQGRVTLFESLTLYVTTKIAVFFLSNLVKSLTFYNYINFEDILTLIFR